MLAVLAFVAYVLFFNDNSVMKNMEYAAQIRDLKEQIAMYEDTLQHYAALNHRLDTNPAELERILREKHHYQRQSEDVYIFVP